MEPAEESTKTRGRRALAPALTILITAAVVAGAGVAGASQSATVYVSEGAGGACYAFTHTAGTACAAGVRGDVTIEAGDTVTWDFAGSTAIHNAASTNAVAADPAWEPYAGAFQTSGSYSRQFMEPGVYEFVCQAHPTMVGTITVEEGDGTATPIPTTSPTPTPDDEEPEEPEESPTPTPTPTATVAASKSTVDDHTQTPAPGKGAKDTVAPRAQTMRLTGGTRSVKVRFWLSEPATVAITVNRRGATTALASTTVQSPAGTRTVTLRDKRFKPGSYTVALRATDAMGNKATVAGQNVRLKAPR